MANQANILSFDEVKRESGAARSSSVAPGKSARRHAPGRASSASSRRSGTRVASSAARVSGTAGVVSARSAVTAYSERGSRSARVDSAPRRGAHAKQSVADEIEASRDEAQDAPEKRSRLQEFRRKRQKGRADKKFDRQFGGARTSDAGSSGPRAAVYKGEMGTNHKRAARMQNDAAGKARTFSLASLNPLAVLSAWKRSPKFIASAGVMVCLLLSCWFLYTPAQQLYQSVREHDRLEAEYAAIEQRNASLQSEVESLQTDAGIEDRAHQQFGWVPEGEQTANVHGLSDGAADGSGSNFTANIVPGSIEAPETWYSPVLDVLFGVK